ncbi:MAG: DNA polymerase III subunit delta [Anaerolineae bacterium]
MYSIFHGEDEFSRAEELHQLRAQLGDPQFADLNMTSLEGKSLRLSELRHHADAIPFLATARLVLVYGLLARLNPRQKKKEGDDEEGGEEEADPELAAGLAAYLPLVPATTHLIFVESKPLYKNNPILKLAEKDKKNARVRLFSPPAAEELPHWVKERAERKGARIDYSAANDLAMFIGADLRALDNELEKLMAYCNGEPITRKAVQALVAPAQEESVFELVDALGKRNTAAALDLLHNQLRHNAAPQYLLTMIVRQYRLLLQARDLAGRGMNEAQIRDQLGMHPFVLRKVLEQSRNYTVDQLERIYEKLLDVDLAMKTSRGDPVINLDVLAVEITKNRG